MAASLQATDISVRFAGVSAIDHVSVTLHQGEILGLIGPNGAGKTTLVNVMSGFQKPGAGSVTINGQETRGKAADWFSRNGVVRSFQAVRLFPDLTVSENVEVGFAVLGTGRHEARRRASALLDMFNLTDKAGVPCRGLNYGDERRVGIARALALSPTFLLLDEPAAGMNVGEAETLGSLIGKIRDDFGCGIMLIEHNMRLVMNICERLHLLSSGKTIAEGSPADIVAHREFRIVYMGSEAE